jgi:hypothetical protein
VHRAGGKGRLVEKPFNFPILRVVGIISIGDLVKTIIVEQQFMIEQLEHYISG